MNGKFRNSDNKISDADIRTVKGRGAVSNQPSLRFNDTIREVDGDWRDAMIELDDPAPKTLTNVTIEQPKTIINYNKSPDIPFDRSINPYRGCEHGCVYCFARPTHAFLDLSPGLDFEKELFVKPETAQLLRKALAQPHYRVAPIAIGTNTDPYQPIERNYRITRDILTVMLETRHPIGITTKSDRVLADIDLLIELAKLSLTAVTISITTLDAHTARIMEPRAPSPQKRIHAIQQLSKAGIETHVNIAPVVPAITDHELEAIAREADFAGAVGIMAIPLRLPWEVAPLFEQWLAVHYPERAHKVMHIIRSMRDDKNNDPRFFHRRRGTGPWAQLLTNRMARLRKKYNMAKDRYNLRNDLFIPPERNGQINMKF